MNLCNDCQRLESCRMVGQAMTKYRCFHCGMVKLFENTATPTYCESCAINKGLCQRCGHVIMEDRQLVEALEIVQVVSDIVEVTKKYPRCGTPAIEILTDYVRKEKLRMLKGLFKKATDIDYNDVIGTCLQRNPTLQTVVGLIQELEQSQQDKSEEKEK